MYLFADGICMYCDFVWIVSKEAMGGIACCGESDPSTKLLKCFGRLLSTRYDSNVRISLSLLTCPSQHMLCITHVSLIRFFSLVSTRCFVCGSGMSYGLHVVESTLSTKKLSNHFT